MDTQWGMGIQREERASLCLLSNHGWTGRGGRDLLTGRCGAKGEHGQKTEKKKGCSLFFACQPAVDPDDLAQPSVARRGGGGGGGRLLAVVDAPFVLQGDEAEVFYFAGVLIHHLALRGG